MVAHLAVAAVVAVVEVGKPMKMLPTYLIFIALIAITFGYWGLETVSGRKEFDEMDGIIPLFTGIGGVALLVASVILLIIQRRR